RFPTCAYSTSRSMRSRTCPAAGNGGWGSAGPAKTPRKTTSGNSGPRISGVSSILGNEASILPLNLKSRLPGSLPPGWGAVSVAMLLPAATQSLVELDDAQQFVEPDLRQIQLSLKLIAVGVEGIQQRIHTAAIAHVGESRPVAQGAHQQLLLLTAFPHPLVSDERVGDLGKSGL